MPEKTVRSLPTFLRRQALEEPGSVLSYRGPPAKCTLGRRASSTECTVPAVFAKHPHTTSRVLDRSEVAYVPHKSIVRQTL